jgi:hypothetical protein
LEWRTAMTWRRHHRRRSCDTRPIACHEEAPVREVGVRLRSARTALVGEAAVRHAPTGTDIPCRRPRLPSVSPHAPTRTERTPSPFCAQLAGGWATSPRRLLFTNAGLVVRRRRMAATERASALPPRLHERLPTTDGLAIPVDGCARLRETELGGFLLG